MLRINCGPVGSCGPGLMFLQMFVCGSAADLAAGRPLDLAGLMFLQMFVCGSTVDLAAIH